MQFFFLTAHQLPLTSTTTNTLNHCVQHMSVDVLYCNVFNNFDTTINLFIYLILNVALVYYTHISDYKNTSNTLQ